MKKNICFTFCLIVSIHIIVAQEQKLQYFGTIYNTFINEDHVSVRDYPSLSGTVSYQINKNTKVKIKGVSKEYQFIDNYNGNWLNIIISENQPNEGKDGWIFSKYVDTGAIIPSELKIVGMSPKEERQAQKLLAFYKINGIEEQVTLYPHKENNQKFYTFAFNIDDEAFHYSNIPGSYVWYPDKNEVKHISYIGTNMESAWVVFTDDFKYLIEDFGTAPPPRGLGIWRVSDGKKVFSGGYYRNINLSGYTIEIIYEYDWWNIQHNTLDNEIKYFAENYKENNPEPLDMVQYSQETGFGLVLIIICEFNFDTGVRKIIKGQYIYTQ